MAKNPSSATRLTKISLGFVLFVVIMLPITPYLEIPISDLISAVQYRWFP